MHKLWSIVKRTVREVIADDVLTLGAALAFYTALSLAPLLILVLALAGFVWQEDAVRAELVRQVHMLIGPSGADAVEMILSEIGRERAHGLAALVGGGTLLFGATGVFAQLQHSLNRIWDVEARPGEDIADFLRKRLLSLGMILAIAFLLVVSLVVSAAVGFISSFTHFELPGGEVIWAIIDRLVSLMVYTGIFTLLHHALPDVKIPWKDSLIGGMVTAVLFSFGKEILAWYLSAHGFVSAYGAAGSFFVVLVWVYYSSLILFVGAELTQALVDALGHAVVPDAHARFVRRPLAGTAH